MGDSARKAKLLWPAIVAFGQGATWVAFIAFELLIEPRYERIFYDFKMPLPALTREFIDLAHCLADYWFLVPVPVVLWAAANGAVVWELERRQLDIGKVVWCGLTWLVPSALLILANLAFLIPLAQLQASFSR